MPQKRRSTKTKTTPTRSRGSKAAAKLDLYAKHKNEYVAGKLPALVRVGPASYLSIAGRSAPGAEDFTRAIGALYNVAFTIKMARKFSRRDYTVTKLEGLWWEPADPMPTATTVWNWQLMLRVPPFISERELQTTIDALVMKGKPADVRRVQLTAITEGECVQILHVGPYTEETPSIERMRAFAGESGRAFTGKHHEIYLSDPRRVKPEKLKTILRYPVA